MTQEPPRRSKRSFANLAEEEQGEKRLRLLDREEDTGTGVVASPAAYLGTSNEVIADTTAPPADCKPFRLMDMPTEIRLEIYRACLTRSYNILLARWEPEIKRKLKAKRRQTQPQSTNTSMPPIGSDLGVFFNGLPVAPRTALFTDSDSDSDSSNPFHFFPELSAYRILSPTSPTDHPTLIPPRQPRPQSADPLHINLLRTSKQIYKEARSILYSENHFTLSLSSAQSTLARLHQRSRRQIKHIELEIPTVNDILEKFQETVRLSLRYCTGLRKFIVHVPFSIPGALGSGVAGNTTVYANGFDILRWLPQGCEVVITGHVCPEVERVLKRHRTLSRTMDRVRYSSFQLFGTGCLVDGKVCVGGKEPGGVGG